MKRIIYVIVFLVMSFQALAQDITVKGTVKDENGEPVPGAAVVDKQNGKNGVVTDIDGKFTITVAAEGFLEISSLGFATLLEPVNSRKEITVTLKTENSKLDEVVVIAYGTAKKSDLTGAVAKHGNITDNVENSGMASLSLEGNNSFSGTLNGTPVTASETVWKGNLGKVNGTITIK